MQISSANPGKWDNMRNQIIQPRNIKHLLTPTTLSIPIPIHSLNSIHKLIKLTKLLIYHGYQHHADKHQDRETNHSFYPT